MSELIKWFFSIPLAANIATITLGLIIIVLIMIYLIAFLQGRDLSFYPPKIGARPNDSLNSKIDNKKSLETALSKDTLTARDIPQFCESGMVSIYFPRTNSERNIKKECALKAAESEIRLLAATGHSYLAIVGNKFKGAIVDRLKNGVNIQIIILNPWSDNALFISIEELSFERLKPKQKRNYESIQQGQLKGFDPVEIIKSSVYYRRKLSESIEGYLSLKKEFKNQIELRVFDHEIVSTILLTEKRGFFEPYINVKIHERMRNLMNTFELEFIRTSYFYHTCSSYFSNLWKFSTAYNDVLKMESYAQAKLRARYK